MFILTTCLFIAALFTLLSKVPLAIAMQQAGGYNNKRPREQARQLHGFGARALGAHENSFEAFILFSAAVLAAIATHQVTWFSECLAVVFVLARVLYHIAYLLNYATLRSLLWTVGAVASFTLLFQSITA